MGEFAQWLRGTPVSLTIQSVEWIVPAIQSLHILAIGFAAGAAFVVCARILGWFGRALPAVEVAERSRSWLLAAIVVLALTGLVLIVGEPVRELMSLSFWLKMGTLIVALVLSMSTMARMRLPQWAPGIAFPIAEKSRAVLVLALWTGVILLGRFIAYDPIIWGALSPLSN